MPENIERSYKEKSFGDVFSVPNVYYEIPFFQRGYVWGKEKWEEFLKEAILEGICNFEDPTTKSGLDKLKDIDENDIENANYYFGTIYLKEKDNPGTADPDAPKRYLVIDGQQRIITIYLFLIKLYYNLDRERGYGNKLTKYREDLFNKGTGANSKSKIYTVKQDDRDLFAIVANNNAVNPNIRGNISDFNTWYDRKISKISPESKYNLLNVLSRSLRITEITLSKNDDEMLIFENLNDKGTPLSGDELLCSYIFKPIIEKKGYNEERVAQLHSEKWIIPYTQIQQMVFETRGRKLQANERYLFFLRTALSIGKNKMLGRDKDIYYTFKREYPNPSSEEMESKLEEISTWVPFFQKAIFPKKYPPKDDAGKTIEDLLVDIDKLKVYTTLTFIMPLLKELDQKQELVKEYIQILNTLYVFLVRRNILGLKTTEDNVIFPRLWDSIKDHDNKTELMKDKFTEKNLFVSDANLKERFLSADIYNNSYKWDIIEKIDRYLCRSQFKNEYPDYTSLGTVEHIFPQGDTSSEWKEYLGDEYSEALNNRVHTIGNLMLVGRSRNSSLNNETFPKKLQKYDANSGLSKHLKENYSQKKWNVETIEERSAFLAEIACKVWSWDIN